MTILVVAGNVLNRLVRSKVLIITLVVVVLIIGLTSSSLIALKVASQAGEFAQARRAAATLFVLLILLMGWFAGLVALVIGVTVTRQEIREGTIFSLLSKPVARWEYLLGSFVGSLFCLLLCWLILAGVFVGLAFLTEQPLGAPQGLILLRGMTLSVLMLSLAFCLAQRFSAGIAASLSLVVYNGELIIGMIRSLFALMNLATPNWVSKTLLYPLPATGSLDVLLDGLTKTRLESPDVGWAFLHLVDYSLLALLLGWWIFHRRDLSLATG